MLPLLITPDGAYDRAAILREAHDTYRAFRATKPHVTLGQRMAYAWERAHNHRRRWIMDRLSGGDPMLACMMAGQAGAGRTVFIHGGF